MLPCGVSEAQGGEFPGRRRYGAFYGETFRGRAGPETVSGRVVQHVLRIDRVFHGGAVRNEDDVRVDLAHSLISFFGLFGGLLDG